MADKHLAKNYFSSERKDMKFQILYILIEKNYNERGR